jgi:nucleotide-binding universal stress UspA family protein
MLATQTKRQVAFQNKRVTFQNILFATDFSEAADAAMPFAADLARSFGANFFAIHVKEPVNYAVPPEMWQSMQQAHEEEERCLRCDLEWNFPEIKPRLLEGSGEVATVVTQAIQEHGIDLVVLGTRGRTGLGKALLGSKAEEILRHAPCAVLTVGPFADCRNRVKGDACGKKPTSIVYATHFGEASLKASRIAVSLAEEYQSKLTLLTVMQPRDRNNMELREEFGEASERELRKLVPEEAQLWCAPRFLVEHGNAAEKILGVARGVRADLIVLGAHRPEGAAGAATHLPTATIHQVITHAECPVLTIRG